MRRWTSSSWSRTRRRSRRRTSASGVIDDEPALPVEPDLRERVGLDAGGGRRPGAAEAQLERHLVELARESGECRCPLESNLIVHQREIGIEAAPVDGECSRVPTPRSPAPSPTPSGRPLRGPRRGPCSRFPLERCVRPEESRSRRWAVPPLRRSPSLFQTDDRSRPLSLASMSSDTSSPNCSQTSSVSDIQRRMPCIPT